MQENNKPEWLLSGERIDEGMFVKEFLWIHGLKCVRGTFYNVDGPVRDEDVLRKEIYEWIFPHVSTGMAHRVNALLELMRLEAWVKDLPESEDVIHLANGTFHLVKGFTTEKEICRHRLPVNYQVNRPQPENWLRFLEDLLEPEDILTLQEYMGYCLIPTTRGQKMLSIIGSGGEGKSRVGVVMKALLGTAMASGSLAKVEMSPFARADLENLLLFVDDDLKMEALPQTNHLKTIITADVPMDLERKYQQSFQGRLHVRFLAFGNGTLRSQNDQSYGFFRRQIILQAKPVPAGRIDDPYLGRKLTQERDSIFLWALEGLYRLRQNDYRFSVSAQAMENREELIHSCNGVAAFLDSEGYVTIDRGGTITSRELYDLYREWCDNNSGEPMTQAAFYRNMSAHARWLGLTPTNNVILPNGRSARGFRGIRRR